MKYRIAAVVLPFFLFVCAAPAGGQDENEPVDVAAILDAPAPLEAGVAPEDREAVARGEYLVELLGCGACHTDGALIGEPRADRLLAGSRVGIAYTSPLDFAFPGIVYPPNLTPDPETGIGGWSKAQITSAIKTGKGRHGNEDIMVMPWQTYARLNDADTNAIVAYLQNIEPVQHRVPENNPPGRRPGSRYVHIGIYENRQ